MKRLILYSLLISLFSACAEAASYDGIWWNAASKGERTGFLAGYIDCATYDAEQKSMINVSWDLLEPRITSFYHGNASDLRKPVSKVLAQLRSEGRAQRLNNGESYSEEHGIFDGEYWRQLLDDERRGFIEGYMACQKEYGKPAASFSRKTRWYVAQISGWYGIRADDPSEINEKRSLRKIADVLSLFKDKVNGKQ